MGFCATPTPEMGEYSVEIRRESFVLRGEDTYEGPKRHALHLYGHKCGQGAVEILTEDIPKIRAALDQVDVHEGRTPPLAEIAALRELLGRAADCICRYSTEFPLTIGGAVPLMNEIDRKIKPG